MERCTIRALKGGGFDQGVVSKITSRGFRVFPQNTGICSILKGLVFNFSSHVSRGFRGSCGFHTEK